MDDDGAVGCNRLGREATWGRANAVANIVVHVSNVPNVRDTEKLLTRGRMVGAGDWRSYNSRACTPRESAHPAVGQGWHVQSPANPG